ncbi:hypothetical protein GCM10022199_23350 [Marihabitans asiaticum]
MVKRREHSGHCRRRRIEDPSSAVRESMTRESVCRQKGQCTGLASRRRERVAVWTKGWTATPSAVDNTGLPVDDTPCDVH